LVSAAKSKEAQANGPTVPASLIRIARLAIGPGRAWVLGATLLAVFGGGWYLVWREVRPRLLGSDQYLLRPENVEMTPLPEWIHTDVRAEVFRDASLGGPLSIMDEHLTERIAGAFSLHPWVAKVERVRKFHPARVQVGLAYRRPVLTVQAVQARGELLPVDAEGVQLPRGDFSQVELSRYPRLVGIDTVPVGPVGTRWGDGRVVDAAEIAAAFGPAWHELKLERIVAAGLATASYGEDARYELFTRSGTRVLWGRGPATKMPSELPAADKVARLKKYAQENGSLEGPAGPQVLDVGALAALDASPRTAETPAAAQR
jgi:hypothetical protein